MREDHLSRRDVLRTVGSAGALAATTGVVAGDGVEKSVYNVGVATPAAERATRRAADAVDRTLDWNDGTKTLTVAIPDAAVENLRQRADVRYVEANGLMHAIGQTLPWGVDRVDADLVHDDGETGGDNSDGAGGADIAIVDTGIDDDHPDLQANVGAGKAFVDCAGSNCNYAWSDDNDHGTHCAGIADAADNTEGVVGVSTDATLHAVKVLDSRGSGSFSDVAAGIKYVADQGWDVASISLGSSSGSSTVKDACQYAYGDGVLLVGSAGNSGPCSDCVGYPAAYEEVVAVSSTDSDDSLSSFSSTGPEVELAAPGGQIYSTVVGGYDTFSGTSMSCPHVSGAGAQLLDNGYTNTEARDRLAGTAEDVGLGTNESGSGLLDVEAAVGSSTSENPPAVDSLTAAEVETSDGDAEFDASWSVSDSDGNLSSVELVLTQDADGTTEDTASVSVAGDTASGTTRLVAAGDEGSGNGYTVELTVTDGTGKTDSATASVSETESTNAAPTASIDSITDNSNPAWARFSVAWSASDSDGNLDSVVVELLDASGSVLDAARTNVGGSSASGSSEVRAKGSASSVRVTATDADGLSDSDSSSV